MKVEWQERWNIRSICGRRICECKETYQQFFNYARLSSGLADVATAAVVVSATVVVVVVGSIATADTAVHAAIVAVAAATVQHVRVVASAAENVLRLVGIGKQVVGRLLRLAHGHTFDGKRSDRRKRLVVARRQLIAAAAAAASGRTLMAVVGRWLHISKERVPRHELAEVGKGRGWNRKCMCKTTFYIICGML